MCLSAHGHLSPLPCRPPRRAHCNLARSPRTSLHETLVHVACACRHTGTSPLSPAALLVARIAILQGALAPLFTRPWSMSHVLVGTRAPLPSPLPPSSSRALQSCKEPSHLSSRDLGPCRMCLSAHGHLSPLPCRPPRRAHC